MISELKRILEQICRDKGISKDLLVKALEEAVMLAAKKRFGHRRDIEVHFNDEYGEIEVFQFRHVVDVVEDEQTEISLSEALSYDPEAQLGDDVGSKMENISELGRIAAQAAKQVLIQKMKDAERDVIFDMYKDRLGEIINGIVQRYERGNIIVNLGRAEAILPRSEQMPRRSYRQGDRMRAYLLEVRQSAKDAQLVLSRTCNQFLVKLFTMEVPEIADGIVIIKGVSRDPGIRAKLAVTSMESDVDPVGACVGMKGSRVQNIVQELQGERIDIVPWSPDPAKYVSHALSPAGVSMVVVDEEHRTLLVVVPDDQLSLAIGKGGQNVRLASQLLGWRIDVKTETKYAKLSAQGYQSLLELPSAGGGIVDKIYDAGVGSIEELAGLSAEELVSTVPGLEPELAEQLTSEARQKIATREPEADAAEVVAAAPEA